MLSSSWPEVGTVAVTAGLGGSVPQILGYDVWASHTARPGPVPSSSRKRLVMAVRIDVTLDGISTFKPGKL